MKNTLIAIDYGKFTENTWISNSNLKQVEKHLKQDNVKGYKVLEQGDIVIEENSNFKQDFLFKNQTEMRKEIQKENKRAKDQAKSDWALMGVKEVHPTQLMSTSFGQLLIIDGDGRIQNPSWMEDAQYYDGDVPTIAELEELYEKICKEGVTKFCIHYEAMVRYWDTYPKKFSGNDVWEKPSDNWASMDLVNCDR